MPHKLLWGASDEALRLGSEGICGRAVRPREGGRGAHSPPESPPVGCGLSLDGWEDQPGEGVRNDLGLPVPTSTYGACAAFRAWSRA